MPVDLSKPHSERRRLNRDAAAGVRQDGMHSQQIKMKKKTCAEPVPKDIGGQSSDLRTGAKRLAIIS